MFVQHRFKLNPKTVDLIREMTPNFGYEGFGEAVFYRTYSREICKECRCQLCHNKENDYEYCPECNDFNPGQENWADVVIRNTNGTFSIRKDWYIRNHINWDEEYWQKYAKRFAIAMFEMTWLPPGRGLWAMGTYYVYERGSMALYNCFSGDTEFYANGKIGKLSDYVDQEVDVLTFNKGIKKATVKSFGKQKLQTVVFKPQRILNSDNKKHNLGKSKLRMKYRVTKDHRWILPDGSVTTNLKVGNHVKVSNELSFELNRDGSEYKEGFCHGLIFGDGTRQTNCPNRYTIRLCKDSNDKLLNKLEGSKYYRTTCQPPSYNGNYVVTLVSNEINFKQLPESNNPNYLRGFLDGWLEADAWCKWGSDSQTLDSINAEAIEWGIKIARLVGYIPTGIAINRRDTNFGSRTEPLNRLKLIDKECIFEVVQIIDEGHEEEVFCVVEPETQSFVLAGGIPTGNCAYSDIICNNLGDDISWSMDCLMNGVGVGGGIDPDDSLKLYEPKGSYDYVIPDTREGWCDGTQTLIDCYRFPDQKKPRFIYDKIRKKGTKIRGFGGICAGAEPLIEYHRDIDRYMHYYLGDMNNYDSVVLRADLTNGAGCCVVAGNVRRSAELLKGRINDSSFMNLKDHDIFPHREAVSYMSNNSVVLERDSDFEMLGDIAKRVIKNGEPGYINKRNLPYARIGKKMKGLRWDKATGFNPCQPGWAKVLTPEGIRTFDDIKEGSLIWSTYGWTKVLKKWSTGINKVYKYSTTANVFYGTENHRVVSNYTKIEVSKASSIDILAGSSNWNIEEFDKQAILDGLVIGDGTYHANYILLNIGEKDTSYFDSEIKEYIYKSYSRDYQYKVNTTIKGSELPVTYLRKIPDRFIYASKNIVASFLRGLYSANGSICGNRITLKAASFPVIEAVQLMLSSLGIKSYWTRNKTKIVEFENGKYQCKESYDLNISTDRNTFNKNIGFIQPEKNAKLVDLCKNVKQTKEAKETYDIVSIELISEEETFDITVEQDVHTYWTQGCNVSNCGEICLESREVCNLAETLPTRCDSLEDWYDACEFATFYCTTVSLLPTHQPSTNRIVARNRRIGISIIDVSGWKHEYGVNKITSWMRNGYKKVRNHSKRFNDEAGVPEPIRVTCGKPGGTTPKCAGRTPGLGNPTFIWTKRRMRVARFAPIHKLFVDANIPYEADAYSANTDVFEFPIKQGPAKPASEVSLWEQAMSLVHMQREWADNAVSCTLYFKPKWKMISQSNIRCVCGQAYNMKYEDVNSETILCRGCQRTIYWKTILDNELLNIKTVYNFPKSFHLNDDDDYECENYKVKFITKSMVLTNIQLFEFDPRNEENDIEPVLSIIAPLTKSVSLLPHSAIGAYIQMPEEGITEEEYEAMKENINTIDWSLFGGSDGIDEKFCTSEHCEIPI